MPESLLDLDSGEKLSPRAIRFQEADSSSSDDDSDSVGSGSMSQGESTKEENNISATLPTSGKDSEIEAAQRRVQDMRMKLLKVR